MTREEMQEALEDVRFQSWRVAVVETMDLNSGWPVFHYLQVQFDADGEQQHGRKWLLSPHMTKSELIQTAFKAVLTALEHEAREHFLYRGKAIFGPHYDVDALHEIVERTDARKDVPPR